jgi:hypothetical protein
MRGQKRTLGILGDVCSHHYNRCEDDICQDDADHSDEGFDVEELMCNVAPDALRDLLYEECKRCDKEHKVLWMRLELMKLKATSRWFDTSFSALLELLTKVLPKPNGLPSCTYQAKKTICPLTFGYRKNPRFLIHCIL